LANGWHKFKLKVAWSGVCKSVINYNEQGQR